MVAMAICLWHLTITRDDLRGSSRNKRGLMASELKKREIRGKRGRELGGRGVEGGDRARQKGTTWARRVHEKDA
jgi:hypothetical protein